MAAAVWLERAARKGQVMDSETRVAVERLRAALHVSEQVAAARAAKEHQAREAALSRTDILPPPIPPGCGGSNGSQTHEPSISHAQAREMFGCPVQSIDLILQDKDPRDIAMYAIEALSDALKLLQEEVPNRARQLMNIAKYAMNKASTVTILNFCEIEFLVLHPNQTYRFRVMPGCQRCIELAGLAKLEGEKSF